MITEKVLQGKKIILRQIELEDCTVSYVKWLNDPKVIQCLETRWTNQDLESIRDFVDEQRKNDHSVLFAIINKRDRKHIGNIKIGPIHEHYNYADISYFIGDKGYWNKGIVTEAIRLICEFGFFDLSLNKIEAGVYENATASWKALEKIGFKREGILRDRAYFAGKYVDIFRYGLLKTEWELVKLGGKTMSNMKYCTRCILPESAETVAFDREGVCNVCKQAEIKHENIDWDERRKILDEIVSRYKGKGQYDCIVPFSGGKDSTFQLWYVVKVLGLRPLVVRFNHWGYRPLVQENNVKTFKKLGVDVLEFTANWQVVKRLMLASLKETGDFCWHCHTGVFAHTMQIAVKFNIPLVIWGEASSEYRAYHNPQELEELDEKKFEEIIDLGISADRMYEILGGTVDKRDLMPFVFPSKEELKRIGTKAIYLGNYIKWHTKEQVEIIKRELGWQGQQVEGIPPQYDYEKIECRWQGVRDYCKYIKRGHGRTNHLACIDIRNNEMERETGLKLAEEYDGKRPASLDGFLRILGISEKEFEEILLENEVFDWGFDHNKLEIGEPLPDMEQWDDII